MKIEVEKVDNGYVVKRGNTTMVFVGDVSLGGLFGDKRTSKSVLGRRRWTKQELTYLRNGYSTQTIKQLADKLKRTPIAIEIKAQKLGLK